MIHLIRRTGVVRPFLLAISMAAIACSLACPASSPTQVFGPSTSESAPSTLIIISPNDSIVVNQGKAFTIEWTDSDPDANSLISFELIDTTTGESIQIVDNIPQIGREDSFAVQTSSVPVGMYYIKGTIEDDNSSSSVYALSDELLETKVVVNITEPGLAPTNTPPIIYVTSPNYNITAQQDDPLVVTAQPKADPVVPTDGETDEEGEVLSTPYDPDDNTEVYLVLDFDDDPTNDNILNPDSNEIIVLRKRSIPAGYSDPIEFELSIDIENIPVRPDNKPYYIRCTITDGINQQVHSYADGYITISQYPIGQVDLGEIGFKYSGAQMVGFNPGARLGTSCSTLSDYDGDGIDDAIIAAQYGNPRNRGNVGEAYVFYGQDRVRFGGINNINSITSSISGFLFQAPVPWDSGRPGCDSPTTTGVTSVGYIPDIDLDGRPEILIGMSHVDGADVAIDFDPGDDPPDTGGETVTVGVAVRAHQGQQRVVVAYPERQSITQSDFDGFQDTFCGGNGTSEVLEWVDSQDKFAVIKISNISGLIPDDLDDISNMNATLRLYVEKPGAPADVYVNSSSCSIVSCGWNENDNICNCTSNWRDLDTDSTEYQDSLNPTSIGAWVTANVTSAVQDVLDGGNNTLCLIIVPRSGTSVLTQVSSKDNSEEDQRPEIVISYAVDRVINALGAYPDPYVNNLASETTDDVGVSPHTTIYSGAQGFASLFSSKNRDSYYCYSRDPERLSNTVVDIESIGSQWTERVCHGDLGAVNAIDSEARIAGCRFMAGWYDDVDADDLKQPPLWGRFGDHVDWMPDVDGDQRPEILISAPTNELDQQLMRQNYGDTATQVVSRFFSGSILMVCSCEHLLGDLWRGSGGANIYPNLLEVGQASSPGISRSPYIPFTYYQIFAEDVEDYLHDAKSAGDFNRDGVQDILCGAPNHTYNPLKPQTGTTYIIFGRVPIGDFHLDDANTDSKRPPMIRITGEKAYDRIGTIQASIPDVTGDRIDDIIIGSPFADFNVSPASCGTADSLEHFETCQRQFGDEVFDDDACKIYDYNNDRLINDDDQRVFDCLSSSNNSQSCCPADNGMAAVIFGGSMLDGDRTLSQIAGSDLPGAVFYGSNPGDRAGSHVASAGDFNRDGFGDFLITAPGVMWRDDNAQDRLGVVYLVFGGPHLNNNTYNLNQVGTQQLPGLILYSPFISGRPDEAPPEFATGVGDINNDSFSDIAIGIPRADFVDDRYPQNPNSPNTDAGTGRRKDGGYVIIIYGHNSD